MKNEEITRSVPFNKQQDRRKECGNCQYSDAGSTPYNWHCRLHNRTISSSDNCISWEGTPISYGEWECEHCGKTGNNKADRCEITSPERRKYYLCHSCFRNR